MWVPALLVFVPAAILVAWAVVLARIDCVQRRLPNPLTVLPGAAAALVAGALAPSILAAGLIWPAAYLLLGLWLGGVGGGDIKLALPLGILAAASAGALGVLAAMALAGVMSTVAAARSGSTPHGPAMLLSAAVVVAVALIPGGFWMNG